MSLRTIEGNDLVFLGTQNHYFLKLRPSRGLSRPGRQSTATSERKGMSTRGSSEEGGGAKGARGVGLGGILPCFILGSRAPPTVHLQVNRRRGHFFELLREGGGTPAGGSSVFTRGATREDSAISQ